MASPATSLVKTKTRTIDGLSIRYAESAPREVSAILLSPWPESLYTFEQMWPWLAEHAHLIAIDLPGFGHSERKDELLESIRFLRAYKTELPKLRKLLPTIETPVQIITGDHDPGVLPVSCDYLHERLPHNKFDKVNAGHFPWADVAEEYADLIIDWWEGGSERSLRSK